MQFDKQQVIDALISETAEQPIQADNFELSVVDENSVLLTYLSYKADANNIVSKTWRTSLWVRNTDSQNPDDWQERPVFACSSIGSHNVYYVKCHVMVNKIISHIHVAINHIPLTQQCR
ncbi:hypothetical protein [Pectobacterium aroidearum]|uniref:hypothetical protein n=1 Tax=Pectobacterium aroidearum TaxID=1201031 RepID=UPI003A6C0CCA